MKYLKVFTDFAEALGPLGEAETGRLFTAMLKYAETGELPDLRGNERFVWPTAKLNIDREVSYCAKQAENGQKGGRPRTRQNPIKPGDTRKTQKDKDNDKDNDKDRETPGGVSSPLPPKGGWDVASPGLLEALEAFEAMRRQIKKPLTSRARTMLLAELQRLSAHEPTQIAILEQSVLHCWQSVYALRGDNPQKAPDRESSYDFDEIGKMMEGQR